MLKFSSVILFTFFFLSVQCGKLYELDYDPDDMEDFQMLVAGGYRPAKDSGTLTKYIVSIRTAKPTAYFGDNHYCCGTLIASRLVLTAAHCVVDANKVITRPKRLTVVAGAPNRLQEAPDTHQFDVKAVVPYKEYRRKGEHDIALLLLSRPIPQDNDAIKILSIAGKRPKPGAVCTSLGWGQLYMHGPYSAEAVYVNLTIKSSKYCSEFFKSYAKGMMCAGPTTDVVQAPCHGDSGGPLICDHSLAGIVSWGTRCSVTGAPTVFTDVLTHYSWITQVNSVGVLQVSVICLVLVNCVHFIWNIL